MFFAPAFIFNAAECFSMAGVEMISATVLHEEMLGMFHWYCNCGFRPKRLVLLAVACILTGCGPNRSIQEEVDNRAQVQPNEPSEKGVRAESAKTDKNFPKTGKTRLGIGMIKEKIDLCEQLIDQYERIRSKAEAKELKPAIDDLEAKLAKVKQEWTSLAPALAQTAEKVHEQEWKTALLRYLKAKQKARSFLQ